MDHRDLYEIRHSDAALKARGASSFLQSDRAGETREADGGRSSKGLDRHDHYLTVSSRSRDDRGFLPDSFSHITTVSPFLLDISSERHSEAMGTGNEHTRYSAKALSSRYGFHEGNEHIRYGAEVLSSRSTSDMFGKQGSPHALDKLVEDPSIDQVNRTSLTNFGTLAARSVRLDDGSVQTIYTVDPEPSLPSTMNGSVMGQIHPFGGLDLSSIYGVRPSSLEDSQLSISAMRQRDAVVGNGMLGFSGRDLTEADKPFSSSESTFLGAGTHSNQNILSNSISILRKDYEMLQYDFERQQKVERDLIVELFNKSGSKKRLREEELLHPYNISNLELRRHVNDWNLEQQRNGDEPRRSIFQVGEGDIRYNLLNGGRQLFRMSHEITHEGVGSARSRLPQKNDLVLMEDVPEPPEGSIEFIRQVHLAFMKYAKALNRDPEERKKYVEDGTLFCLACGRFSKPYAGTHSLVMHTCISQKMGLRSEHLGLCKAICTIMGWRGEVELGCGKSYQLIMTEEAKANREDLILWPPVVVIHNAAASGARVTQKDAAILAVRGTLKAAGLSHEMVEVSIGRRGTVLIKYPASLSSLNDAERLHLHFVSTSQGRNEWERLSEQNLEQVNDGRKQLYGYLALAHDLEKVDLDYLEACIVKSKKEIN